MAFPVGGRIAEASKARVRKGSLLRGADLRILLDQATVGDIALRLRETSYAAVLKDAALEGSSLEDIRRGELEFLLNVSVLAEGMTFRHYANLGDRKMLDLWLESFDVALIKNHLQFSMNEAEGERLSPDRILGIVSDFRLTLVDQEKLLSGSSLRDLLASVRRDSLREALFEGIPPGSGSAFAERGPEFQKTMFALGMILDRCYFDSLYAAASALSGEEGRMMRVLVGTRIDLLNLYWIYRARRFFGMPPEEALTLILKARYRVNFELLTKAAFAPPSAFASTLEGTPYAAVFGGPEVPRESQEETASGEGAALREVAVECRLYKLLLAVANRIFMSGTLGFQNVAAYLTLREFEVRDIIAIVETVRYGFDKSKTDLILINAQAQGGEARSPESGLTGLPETPVV
ncbi:MAG: V-type ATPase subunit [Synergistaceae bacterium]|jgi:V/A-type H+-transporting ATPase subunit C|nr:V-type ATPase subunit [Synergistaceae bacterium]